MQKRSSNYRYNSVTDEDSKQSKLAKIYQNEILRKDEAALTELLDSDNGRWFIMRLLDRCKVLAQCFTGNSTTFYNEGRRDVGREILVDIQNLGIEAMKLKQLGEIEYMQFNQRALEIAKDYSREDEHDGQ